MVSLFSDSATKISLLVPTRGRPDFMVRLWKSALETSANPSNLEISFCLDNDDKNSMKMYREIESPQTNVVSTKRYAITLSEKWNYAYSVSSGGLFMHCADDVIFRSKNWDEILIAEFEKVPDRILFVHGRDGAKDARLGTLGFLHKNWVGVIGYFVPPYFNAGYNDAWLTEVSDRINRRRFVPEIFTEHMHFKYKKAPFDNTYRDLRRKFKEDNVKKIWADREPDREEDAKKLKKFIENFESKKD